VRLTNDSGPSKRTYLHEPSTCGEKEAMKNLHLFRCMFLFVCILPWLFAFSQGGGGQHIFSPGYEDTPMLPGGRWHVHDAKRPHPRIVDPGTPSTQEHTGQAPSDAVMLFNGSNLDQWRSGKGDAAGWKVEGGYMEVVPGKGDIYTRREFGDLQLHVEWCTPESTQTSDTEWGNSGVFLYGVYEVQVWDSYHTDNIYADGQAGAIYGQYPPLVNSSRKRGEWQVYDLVFTPPRFTGGKLQAPAYVTIFQNGVVIHNHTALLGETGHRTLPPYVDHGSRGPIRLQDHQERVRYRNIWVRELKGYDEP